MENLGNVIYAYKKKSSNKIVYVGQTINLPERHKVHTQYDPFNKNTREYDYPLSRGIRKYGVDEYELIILESNVKKEDLNDREKYWIKYYNTYWDGYNQSIGGTYPTKPIFDDQKIDTVIEMLKDESYSYNDIIAKTGISMTHIYNINTGVRRRRDDLTYPIRKSNTKGTKGLKLSPEENLEIHNLLKNTSLSYEEIGQKYGVKRDTIGDINAGKTKSYLLENWTYPIRSLSRTKATKKMKLSKEQVEQIVGLLLDSSKPFYEIASMYGVSSSTISGINSGRTKSYYIQDINYPIRK